MRDPLGTEQGEREGLGAIFSPRSVAVIGASRDPSSMSGRLFRNLLESFQGPVYPVNPHATEIASVPTFPFILAVPGPVDLAFIAVPVQRVLDVVRECIGKGVRGLVVITAGFSETGEPGRELQRELRDMVRAAGIRMVGPNCFGVFNTDPAVRLQGTFAGATTPPGNIGIGAQSGALGVVIPDYLGQWRLGASTFASVGNKADVSENDLLAYWRDDPATDVILLYLESFSDPAEFLRLARETSRHKPVVALKAARTDVGRRAAGSHTAAIVSPNRASEALLAQSGVVRVETLEELFEVAALLSSQPLPRGDRVAILTNAGGPGILCADALATRGLLLPEPSTHLQAELRKLLRAEAAVKNPVDLIGTIDAEEYRRCLELLLSSREFDAVISIYVPREPGTSNIIARAIREATEKWGEKTTSLAVVMQTDELPEELRGGTTRLPGYWYPEAAASALAAARRYARWREMPDGRIPDFSDIRRDACREIIEPALGRLDKTGGWLEPEEVHQLLDAAGVRVPRWRVACSADEAVAMAADGMGPVVVKTIAPGLLHKSDVGGVVVNVTGESAVRDAFRQVTSAVKNARGALLQEFVPRGEEAFIGVVRDLRFGHLLALGCGGTLVELLDDVACRLHPLTDEDVNEMVSQLRTGALLTGYRGRAPADVDALKELLLRVSRLITLVPEIAELDLNPVLVQPEGKGVMVPDARIRIAHDDFSACAAHSAR